MLINASVRESVARLLEQAEAAYEKGSPKQAARYVKMVMELLKKHRIRLKKEQRNRFCRKCCAWWEHGKTNKLVYDSHHHLIRIICQCGATRTI